MYTVLSTCGYSMLQYVAVRCSALQSFKTSRNGYTWNIVHCNTLQHTATHYITYSTDLTIDVFKIQVSKKERERERERDGTNARARKRGTEKERECVCVRERESDSQNRIQHNTDTFVCKKCATISICNTLAMVFSHKKIYWNRFSEQCCELMLTHVLAKQCVSVECVTTFMQTVSSKNTLSFLFHYFFFPQIRFLVTKQIQNLPKTHSWLIMIQNLPKTNSWLIWRRKTRHCLWTQKHTGKLCINGLRLLEHTKTHAGIIGCGQENMISSVFQCDAGCQNTSYKNTLIIFSWINSDTDFC